jgi:hypothetical protein
MNHGQRTFPLAAYWTIHYGHRFPGTQAPFDGRAVKSWKAKTRGNDQGKVRLVSSV